MVAPDPERTTQPYVASRLIRMPTDCIGFVGGGQMARALARGFVDAGLVPSESVLAHDPLVEAGEQFQQAVPGSQLLSANSEVVERSATIVLAVKPQQFRAVAVELAGAAKTGRLFVSILAGVDLATLCEGLANRRVIRVMPNTPCLVGCGASGYALGPEATREDGEQVARMLGSVGLAIEVPESQLDAVTGLSGSGPAYVYAMIEALSDGGVRVGLPRATATRLAAQTVLGAARMVLATSEHPAVLRDRVTSPGGTTIAGLKVLESRALRSALLDAVEAATLRARELGRPS
jgi:pyrroline-5-carboxylate reductase